MLVLTRKLQEKITIAGNITVTVLRVKGQTVRIGIEAPREIRVVRGELPMEAAKELEDGEGAVAATPSLKLATPENAPPLSKPRSESSSPGVPALNDKSARFTLLIYRLALETQGVDRTTVEVATRRSV